MLRPSTNSPEQVFQWTPAVSGTATIHDLRRRDVVRHRPVRPERHLRHRHARSRAPTTPTGCGTTEPNDHHASRVTLDVTAGQTYFIVVDGYNGANGTFTLDGDAAERRGPDAPTRTATPVRDGDTDDAHRDHDRATRTADAARPRRRPTATPLPPTATRTVDAASRRHVPARRHGRRPDACNPIQVPPAGRHVHGHDERRQRASRAPAPSPATRPIRSSSGRPPCSGTAIVAHLRRDDLVRHRALRPLRQLPGHPGRVQRRHGRLRRRASRTTTMRRASRLAVTAGQTYFIVVDGYNGASGNFTLTITPPARREPDGDRRRRADAHRDAATATPTRDRDRTPTADADRAPRRRSRPRRRPATPTPPTADAARPTPIADRDAAAGRLQQRRPWCRPRAAPSPASTSARARKPARCGVTDKSGERVFQWTPAVSGQATIGTCGTATLFDTVLYLRSGTCGGAELALRRRRRRLHDRRAERSSRLAHHADRDRGPDVFHRRRRLQRRERRLQPDDHAADGTDGDADARPRRRARPPTVTRTRDARCRP